MTNEPTPVYNSTIQHTYEVGGPRPPKPEPQCEPVPSPKIRWRDRAHRQRVLLDEFITREAICDAYGIR